MNPPSGPVAGRFSFDDAGLPRIDARVLRLAPKERAALALLVQRQPAVASKDDFAAAAWNGQSMSDESLARCISRLRRALAPFGLRIEAVYGTGYRLLDTAAAGSAAPPAPAQETYEHARRLLLQRTPVAAGLAITLLRELVREAPAFGAARVALAEGLAAAVGWGQLPTAAAVDEGLQVLAALPPGRPAPPGQAAARGALLDMAWRFDEAALAFAEALAAEPEHPDTLLSHARHLLMTGQPDAAVAQLRTARRLAPHSAPLRLTLARALVQAGRPDDALAEAQAAAAAHPGELFVAAFGLSLRALVAPGPELEVAARRLGDGLDPPPFAWTVLSYVLARLGRRDEALDIVETLLLCQATSTGEATLYAAPLASLGECDQAAALLQRACDDHCGMLALVLRDPAHAHWLPHHAAGRALLRAVFGAGA